MKKKVIKNLQKGLEDFVPKFEKKFNVVVSYYDGKTFNLHFYDNVTKRNWRTPCGVWELFFAKEDHQDILELGSAGVSVQFVPEEYHG